MVEETDLEKCNSRNRVIRHTVMHHSLTSIYIPNFTEIKKNFLWTDGRTYVHTYGHTY